MMSVQGVLTSSLPVRAHPLHRRLQAELASTIARMSETGGNMWQRFNRLKVQVHGDLMYRMSVVVGQATTPQGGMTHKMLPPPPDAQPQPPGQQPLPRYKTHPGLLPMPPRIAACQAGCVIITFAGGHRRQVLLANGAVVR